MIHQVIGEKAVFVLTGKQHVAALVFATLLFALLGLAAPDFRRLRLRG